MGSWVYVFSKFTHEAMLFEALLLFVVLGALAAYTIMRKRKYGVAGREIPSNLVKVYLSQLVGDAEDLRTQLFGLLGKGEISAQFLANLVQGAGAGTGAAIPPPTALPNAAQLSAAPTTVDPNLAARLKEFEAKMREQALALENVLNEKMKLEEELANLRAEQGAEGAADPGKDKTKDLMERVKTLEAQLGEYAIIEDDLANLKRLQKENKALRSQLDQFGTKGPAAPAAPELPGAELPAAEAAAPAPVVEATAPTPAPALETAPVAETAPAPEANLEAAPAPTLESAPAPTPEAPAAAAAPEIAAAAPDAAAEAEFEAKLKEADAPAAPEAAAAEGKTDVPNFDALVDQVEKSLEETPTAGDTSLVADKASTAPAPEAVAAAAPEMSAEEKKKSEEELQADFEKMLNS